MEVETPLTAAEVLERCRARGLDVRSETTLAGRPGSRHWHIGHPDRPGTLEVTEWHGRVSLKVASNRDGGWASATAAELAH